MGERRQLGLIGRHLRGMSGRLLAVVIGGASGIHRGTLVVLLKIDLDGLKGAEALFGMREGNLKGTEEFSESQRGTGSLGVGSAHGGSARARDLGEGRTQSQEKMALAPEKDTRQQQHGSKH